MWQFYGTQVILWGVHAREEYGKGRKPKIECG
jgi:hypothetical protein